MSDHLQGAAGVSVLELSERLSGAFAGLILGAQGANVRQWRQGLNRRLDRYESAYFDRHRSPLPEGAKLATLLREADVILCDLDPATALTLGLRMDALSLRPGQVFVSVTSMGLDGPQSGYTMESITEWAAGGLGYVTRRAVPDSDVEHYAPVFPPGRQPEVLGGLAAAIAAVHGLRSAGSEGLVIDVSRQEVQAAMLHGTVPPYVWNNLIPGSPSMRLTNIGMLLPSADGHVYIRTVEPHHWGGLVSLMGSPEWTTEPWAQDPYLRRENSEMVCALIGEWSSQHTTAWLVAEGQRLRVPIAFPRDLPEVLESEQLATRGAWVDVALDDGAVGRAPRIPMLESAGGSTSGPRVAGSASVPRQLRVLDMGWSWAGPFAGMILADLGADVVKLESATRIDILRWSGAFAENIRDHERSGYYTACNRGKKSVALNLKHPDARQIVLDLVAHFDILIENFAPRVMADLGLSIEELHAANPNLVVISMSGYGANGPERDFTSYGDHLLHASGIASLIGEPEDPHTKIGIFYGDPVGGMYAALAAMLAVRQVECTGKGTHLELSQLEGLTSLIPAQFLRASTGQSPERSAHHSPTMHPHGTYRCQGEDSWVSLAVTDDAAWTRFIGVLGACGERLPAAATLAERIERRAEIDEVIGTWTAGRTAWEVTHALQSARIAAYPVQSAPRLLWDDHLHARGFFNFVHRPVVGPGPIPGPIFTASDGSSRVRGYAPFLGEHNGPVYGKLLGFSTERLNELVASGLIQ